VAVTRQVREVAQMQVSASVEEILRVLVEDQGWVIRQAHAAARVAARG
jgi:hypothetical protein